MLNADTTRDAAHLGILNSAAQAYENWHNAQVEAIHKRMMRRHLTDSKRLEIGGIAVRMPSPSLFVAFAEIDTQLRETSVTDVDDRRRVAEIRMQLRDSMSDLCDFELDHSILLLETACKTLDWMVSAKARGGSRRNRLLGESAAQRLVEVLPQIHTLLDEVIRVRALVAA